MTIDPTETWRLDDAWRRLSTRLFDDVHQTPERIARNEIYRGAIALLFDAVMNEWPAEVISAADRIVWTMNSPLPTEDSNGGA